MTHQSRDSPKQDSIRLLGPLEDRVLGLMLLRPERSWYRSELARDLDVSPSSLQRTLTRLSKFGVLKTRPDGNRLYFQADTDSPVYWELRGLIAKTTGLADVLRSALDPVIAKVDLAFVYGSIASGEATSSSDVDLLVVGSVRRSEIAEPLLAAAATLAREVNVRIFTTSELRAKQVRDDAFLLGILNRPRLPVVGTEDDLARIVGPTKSGS